MLVALQVVLSRLAVHIEMINYLEIILYNVSPAVKHVVCLFLVQDEMDSMLETQEKLKKGSQQLNQMLEDMEKKQVTHYSRESVSLYLVFGANSVSFTHSLLPQRDVDQNIDMLNSKNAELESVLDYLRAQPETIDVDEAVTATNPLYNQSVLSINGSFEWMISLHYVLFTFFCLIYKLLFMCLCLFLHRILRLYAQENAVDDTIYFLGEALRKGVIELEVFLKVRGCP